MERKMFKVNLENPIKSKKDDIFGYDYETKRIKNAIDNNANMIGIISDYGSGKSSLIELLKRKLCFLKYKFININLWDKKIGDLETELDAKGNKIKAVPTEKAIVNLHKTFLRQISLQVNKYNSDYINRRINANYGVAKISFPSFMNLFIWFGVYLLLLILTLILIVKFGFDINVFSEITSEMKESFILYIIPKIPLILTGFIFFYIIFNKEVLFSFWKNSIKREISEEDTIQLYNELFGKRFKFLSWIPRFRKIVIVIEDLDRIENEDAVNFYLNEFYRLYIEGNSNNKEGITLIFCLKDFEKNENIDLYNKIFDYVTYINQINYDDREAVLDQLISKDYAMKKILNYNSKSYSLSDVQWLIEGEKIDVRIIKRRIEIFKDIYMMICSRNSKSIFFCFRGLFKTIFYPNHVLPLRVRIKKYFDDYNIKTYVNITTCSFIAYIKTTYNIELKKILSIYDEKHMTFIDYCLMKKLMNEDMTYNHIKAAFAENLSEVDKKEFDSESIIYVAKQILTLIKNGKFDFEYKKYFYNFPLNTKIFNVNEKYVSDVILKDNEISLENIESINDSFDLVGYSFVENNLKRIADLGKDFPKVCLYDKTAMKSAINIDKDKLNDLVQSYFYIDENNLDNFCSNIDVYKNSNLSHDEIHSLIAEPVNNILSECNDIDDIIKVRKKLLDIFDINISLFDNLFNDFEISKDEIEYIKNINVLKTISSLVNHTDEIDKMLCEKYNSLYNLKFEDYYEFLKSLKSVKARFNLNLVLLNEKEKDMVYNEVSKSITADSKINWLLRIEYYNNSLLDLFIDDKSVTPSKLVEYMNKFTLLTDKSVSYLEDADILFDLSDNLVEQLPGNTEISLAYRIYKNKTDVISVPSKMIESIFLKYSELTNRFNNDYMLKTLLDKRTYKKLDSSNFTENKVMIFSQCNQNKDLLSSIINNNDISLEIKEKYISSIKKLNHKAINYIEGLINGNTNIGILQAIYNNRTNIFNDYMVQQKRIISRRLKSILDEHYNENTND